MPEREPAGRNRWLWRAVMVLDLVILYLVITSALMVHSSRSDQRPVESLRVSHAPKARVVQVLGQPEMRFGPADFLHGFPLPGYHYHRHPVKAEVWVYQGHSGRQPSKTYVYFDSQGRVEWTKEVFR